jgi:BlaI family penicillinase repressor
MARPSAIVTEAELSVLNHLWEHGPSVVREISRAIYAKNTPAYHATVNSLLDQLEKKRYVSRDRSGFAHRFTAIIERSALVGSQLQQIADSYFDGALTPMLLPLVDKISLSKRDRDTIRKLIEKAREE